MTTDNKSYVQSYLFWKKAGSDCTYAMTLWRSQDVCSLAAACGSRVYCWATEGEEAAAQRQTEPQRRQGWAPHIHTHSLTSSTATHTRKEKGKWQVDFYLWAAQLLLRLLAKLVDRYSREVYATHKIARVRLLLFLVAHLLMSMWGCHCGYKITSRFRIFSR